MGQAMKAPFSISPPSQDMATAATPALPPAQPTLPPAQVAPPASVSLTSQLTVMLQRWRGVAVENAALQRRAAGLEGSNQELAARVAAQDAGSAAPTPLPPAKRTA